MEANGTTTKGKGRPSIVILGAGLAGLWVGDRLLREGHPVTILEKAPITGGLMETRLVDGVYFDLGPHIFLEGHLPQYRDLVGEDIRPVRGFYGFGFRGKQVLSPIHPMNLLRTLGITQTVPMVLSLLYGKLARRPSAEGFANVEEVLRGRFGERICAHFFRDYIPKVTGIPSVDVSPDWFLERYRFYQEHSLWANILGKALKSLTGVVRKADDDHQGLHLYYPLRGAQMVTDALADRIRTAGGTLLTNATVERVSCANGRAGEVSYRDAAGALQTVSADRVISTLPITDLVRMLDPTPPKAVVDASGRLGYRRLALFFLLLDRERLSDKIQIYFPEKRYPFKRIYEPKNLDPTMGEPGKTGICVEVCFGEEDGPFERIRGPMYRKVLDGLHHFFGVEEKEVSRTVDQEVSHAYAIYRNGYEAELGALAAHLFRYDHLVSYGRQGSFRYNHLVDRVIDAADAVLRYLEAGGGKAAFLGKPDAKSDFF